MKFKDIIHMSLVQIREMGRSAKESAYSLLKGMSTRRANTFAKHGAQIPGQLTRLNAPAGALSDKDLDKAIAMQSSILQTRGTRYAEAVKMQNERREMLKERFGLEDLTDEQFDQYGRFMDEMQQREGAKGWSYASALAKKMAVEALRLNMDPAKFMRNFDYWSDHLEDLERARPLVRSRPVRASDYIKQLKLPTIRSWKNDN